VGTAYSYMRLSPLPSLHPEDGDRAVLCCAVRLAQVYRGELTKAYLQQAIEQGIHQHDVAHKLGLDQSSVSRAAARFGLDWPDPRQAKRLPPVTREQLDSAMARGVSQRALADELGVRQKHVWLALQREGLAWRRTAAASPRCDRIVTPEALQRAIDEGLSATMLAVELGVSETAVRAAARRANLALPKLPRQYAAPGADEAVTRDVLLDAMARGDVSQEALALQLGVKRDTVRRALARENLQWKPVTRRRARSNIYINAQESATRLNAMPSGDQEGSIAA
jgi:biotin operon repressor